MGYIRVTTPCYTACCDLVVVMENSACLLEAQQIIDDWLKDDLGAANYGSGNSPPHAPPSSLQNRKSRNKRAKNKTVHQPYNEDILAFPEEWNGDLENADYITGMDFVNTDISHCVEQVMAGMYTQPVERNMLKMIESQPTTSNPAITMEMRHKQVKSRRQHREHHRSILLRAQVAEKESRLAAERRVKSEQEALKAKQRQEEALVKLEMVKIRKQLKEKQERERLLQELDETLGNGTHMSNGASSPPHGVLSTATQVMDEELKYRMIAETRRVLVKQLAEAEMLEIKENDKLLRQCFNAWLDVVNNAKLIKERVCAMWAWQTKCRVFQSWRRIVEQSKRQQELATLALQLQWEKRCLEMSSLHYRHTLVAKVFTSWKQWLHGCQEARSMEQMRQQQHHKMTALLSRVTAACQHDPTTLEKECQHDPSTLEKERQHDPPMMEKEHQRNHSTVEKQHDSSTLEQECQHERECSVTKSSGLDKECNSKGHHDPAIVRKKRQPLCNHNPKRQDATIGLITSKLVRQELEKLLAEKRALTSQSTVVPDHVGPDHVSPDKTVTAPVMVATTVSKQQQQPNKLLKKQSVTSIEHQSLSLNEQNNHKTLTVAKQPPTKPLPLLGMERRAHMMAERRQARMERQRQREEQILAAKQQEQQEREAAALAEKEALIRKKKEERQLAKQKEKEKQQQLAELQKKVTIATKHYNDWLLKCRGMLPWKQFIGKIHEDNKAAVQFYVERICKTTLLIWKQHFEYKRAQRNKKADKFYDTMVTRRSLTVWRKYVNHMKYVNRHAEQLYRWLLIKRCFRGWHAYVRQQEIKMWEKERRAKVYYHWSLKRKMLLSWHRFIPVAKEEKLREQRKDELRKKVAKWLPDYQTAINSED